jgi:hypothetical protein
VKGNSILETALFSQMLVAQYGMKSCGQLAKCKKWALGFNFKLDECGVLGVI